MARVYVAAGSNVEPETHLALAVRALERAFGPLIVSPWYRNTAAGFKGADFINFVVGFDTSLPAHDVRARLQRIEEACGRPRDAPKWAPRTMDLDILIYADRVSDEPGLVLPRPDLLRRAYMLGPLADIAPQLVHPVAHVTIGELWNRFDRESHPLVPTQAPAAVTTQRCGHHRRPGSVP